MEAIASVERGDPLGPGGVLCWTKAAWREETNLDYAYAKNYETSRVLAISRLSRHASQMKDPTIQHIAESWCYGVNGRQNTDYGQRVSNLYHDR